MIMSTLALGLAGLGAPATEAKATPGFWKRFIETRQVQVNRIVRARLAKLSDAELARFGWSKVQIGAWRTGGSRSTTATQGGMVS
jgi:hypothetical protein